MSSNANERDVARRFGFARTPLWPGSETAASPHSGSASARLGIRPGDRVTLAGSETDMLRTLLGADGVKATTFLSPNPVDTIVFSIGTTYALSRITELVGSLTSRGALWIVWPSDRMHIAEGHVRRAGRAAGLVPADSAHLNHRLRALKFQRGTESR